jgi:hypothetical protein
VAREAAANGALEELPQVLTLQLLPACKLHPVLQPIEFPVLVLLHLLLPVTHVHV